MDPSNPESFNHRTERLSTGNTYHFVDQIPENYNPTTTPTLLCVHGFPDLWYGWRYVIAPWVQKYGWRVVVPDMLGYGGTNKPSSPEHYSTKSLCADLAALLDLISVPKAVVLGHDWGSATAWRFALWHPDRIRALVTFSIPFAPPRQDYLSLEQVVERMPIYDYQLYFNDPSSTKEIEDNLSTFITILHSRPRGLGKRLGQVRSLILDKSSEFGFDTILNEQACRFERNYYLNNYQAGGMNGPLNYYRTTKYRFEEETAGKLPTCLPASLPVLFLWGDKDRTCSQSQVGRMHNYVPSLKIVPVPGKGHWLMVESADVVVGSVADFLRVIFSVPESRL
ncbi:alpha/beta-hydrolase [Ramaria rubella]|nr:alpha/beta-hydrolase [Ramaria rubella]